MGKDVLVEVPPWQVNRLIKKADNMDYGTYSDLNGKPKDTDAGDMILFCHDGEVIAKAVLIDVRDGKFVFDVPQRTERDLPVGVEPPEHGFRYLEGRL